MIYLNSKPVNTRTFPNGEKTLDMPLSILKDKNKIVWKYESDEEFVLLSIVESFIFHNSEDISSSLAECHVLYMPYSRMDRSQNGSPFSLEAVYNLLPKQFSYIIYEPHSNVIKDIDNRQHLNSVDNITFAFYTPLLLDQLIESLDTNAKKRFVLMLPDKGAYDRYVSESVLQNDRIERVLYGSKVRDFDTGRIESLELEGATYGMKEGFVGIIVDDLSSYGNTFIMSQKALREAGATEVHLIVGHAEESAFKGSLIESVDSITTTNSINSGDLDGIKNIKISNVVKLINNGILK